MKRYLDQLKPQERRWVVGGGFVLFLLLNYFFVWPHFGDWARNDARLDKANQQMEQYSKELRHKPEYDRKIRELQADSSPIPPEEQAIDFIHFYSSRAINNHVVVTTQGALTTRTNEFFLEQQMGINVMANETNLVNFLYSLGAGNSMMRVRAMSLRPDQPHQNLNASITLVASYQKKPGARSSMPAAPGRSAAAMPRPEARDAAGAAALPERSRRATNANARIPGFAATNHPVPSIAKRP